MPGLRQLGEGRTEQGEAVTDIVKRLTAWTIDWDDSRMVDGEPPRDGIHCDVLREAAAEIECLRGTLAEAQRDLKSECERRDEIIASTTKLWKDAEAENTRLRAALANSQSPCVYCSLPADEWAKCQSGFPGCARADDAMGCPHLWSSLENIDLRAALAEARGLLGAFYRADIDPHKYDRTAQWLERNP